VNWITPSRFSRTSFQSSTITVVAAVDETRANASRIMCDRNGMPPRPSAPFQGLFREAPSAASLALEYFKTRLKRDCTELVHWADRIDSADFTRGMVLHPEKPDYVLLSMTVSGEDGDGQPYRIIAMLVKNESATEAAG
jgi:hypothetical protein